MAAMEQTAPRKGNLMMNPLIRKINKVEEQSPDHPATYAGIAGKTGFFMLAAVIGIVAYFILARLAPGQAIHAGEFTFRPYEAVIGLFALLVSIFAPLLAFAIRPLVPVLGALYCASIGYTITWASVLLGKEYQGMVLLALGITILLVAIMAWLYSSGIVKVGKKFRTIVTTLFITAVCSGLIVFLLSLIPALRPIIGFARENPVISLVGGVIYILIACAFLLVDFDTIQNAVERQLPKKYEWAAAFGLAYTIIFLFLKVLDLIATVKDNNGGNAVPM